MENIQAQQAFQRLLTIMDELREQCPWDKKQTIDTLRPLTIEELFELTDAIMNKDWKGIKEELGDLLLHIAFYARIGKEEKQFSIEEVLNGICDKLVYRHPHIYADTKVNNEDDVKKNWEQLKMREGKKSVLEGVPVSLSSLIKASRIQEKAAKIGFDWPAIEPVWEKVEEEIQELKEAIQSGSQAAMEDEMGDVLFSLVNYARFINVDPDTSLENTNRKFIRRFRFMEKIALERSLHLASITLEQMDALWNEAKIVLG
ncbi:MAG: nucleoside triphosphate pyrophosphohydrolase [Chitinophagaceae bacterium]